MRYLIAIIHTILLVLVPLIMIPFLQWYKKEFCEPETDLSGIYMLMCFISIGMFTLTAFKWVSAILDKDMKDL